LVKKAAELATLCGVSLSLIFTDLDNDFHYFTNNKNIKITLNKSFTAKHKKYKVYDYDPKDVRE
jgi:hypothetical protein